MTTNQIKRQRPSKKRILTLLIGIALGLGLYAMLPEKTVTPPDAADKATVKVITQQPTAMENIISFEAVGTASAIQSIGIFSPVNEEVREIFFHAGEAVTKGQQLFQLDNRHEILAKKLAQVRLKDAQSLRDRYVQAGKNGAVPESEVDAARADFEAAQVTLDQAILDLEDRKIIAPFDGIVGIATVDEGDRITSDELLTTLDNRQQLRLDFQVPEALAKELRRAQAENTPITAHTPAFPNTAFSGFIEETDSRLNPATRTMMARAIIDNTDDTLRPGMSFRTTWDVNGGVYPAVPEIALQWGRDGSYIWIIRDGKSVKTPAQVMARDKGMVLLSGNFTTDDDVVIEGVQRLRPDLEVRALDADSSEAL